MEPVLRLLVSIAVLLAVAGLGTAAGGIWLATLGGSWYYVIAGLVLIGIAWFLYRRQAAALWLCALLLLATTGWSLWEVGLHVWLLMPRLLVPLVIGIVLALPFITRRIDKV